MTGELLDGVPITSETELEGIFARAAEAVLPCARLHPRERAAFLRHIALGLENQRAEIVDAASLETALGPTRLNGELTRTTAQLKLFADVVEEGSWVDARIDPALPQRTPPRPDLRSMRVPVGVVGVFGASNFPLAFSVAGGDTVSALAAGCPVIVKGHNAHPRTGWLVGQVIKQAVQDCGLPVGTFSLVYGSDNRLGERLVQHPVVKAVGFTGSRTGGLALSRLARERREPIPVYAEMSSINPVVLLSGAVQERSERLAMGLHASFTLGAGQFCTNPGLVFVPAEARGFLEHFKSLVEATDPFHLLSPGIENQFREGTARLNADENVELLAQGTGEVAAHAFLVQARDWSETLEQEVFGPCTVLCLYQNPAELESILSRMEGQLTLTVHSAEPDQPMLSALLPVLQDRAGRLVVNGFPTGVEVCPAMVHGGPFPATTDPGSTSVGTRALLRFTRLVCFQDVPQDLLPAALQDPNPLGIRRLREGEPE